MDFTDKFKIYKNITGIIISIFATLVMNSCALNINKKDSTSNNKVKLYGTVTDFNKKPVDGAIIRVKNKKFENLYETVTDKNGKYSLEVEKGTYYAIYSIKEKDYVKRKLEYWAWNVPINKDLEINPMYDRIEIYGIHAFEPKTGPFDTYRIYFRPMSLTKYQEIKKINKGDTINIAPEKLTISELKIKINDVATTIKTIDKVLEYNTSGNYIFAYEVQVIKPEKNNLPENEKVEGYDKISIEINSSETNEKGKAEYFIKKNKLD